MPHAGGRPSKYKPKYIKEMIKFFNIEPFRVEKVITTGKNDYRKEEPKLIANTFPTMERFACNINVDTDTLVEWASAKNKSGKLKYPEFSVTYKKCKSMQKDILVANGLNGLYQSNFAIFVAKNATDMRDKQEVDVTSQDEKITGITYIVPKTDEL